MVELSTAEKKAIRKVKAMRNINDCSKFTGISRLTLGKIIDRGTALRYHLDLLTPYLFKR
jgi:hypothetical protein